MALSRENRPVRGTVIKHEQASHWGRRVADAIGDLETTVEAVTSSVDYLEVVGAEPQNFDSYDVKEAVARLLDSLEDLRGMMTMTDEAAVRLLDEGRAPVSDEQAFLRALGELSQRFGVTIDGCGCCGSPRLRERDPKELEGGRYSVEDSADLSWEVPLPPLGPDAKLVDSDGTEIPWPDDLRAKWAESYVDPWELRHADPEVRLVEATDDGYFRVDKTWGVRLNHW